MNVQGNKPISIHGLSPKQVESFIAPGRLWSGTTDLDLNSAKIVTMNLGIAAYARFQQIVHLILNGDWVTDQSIRESIRINILKLSRDLEPSRYTSQAPFDQKMEMRKWIHGSVVSLRKLCDHFKSMKDGEAKIDDLSEALDTLDKINDQAGRKESTDWQAYDTKEKINAQLINLVYDDKTLTLSAETRKKLEAIADRDLRDESPLYIFDQVRTVWNILLNAFNFNPPNEVLKQFSLLKDLVETLDNAHQEIPDDRSEIISFDQIRALKTEKELREVFRDELQDLIREERSILDAKTWIFFENPVSAAVKHNDFSEKSTTEMAEGIKSLQHLLYDSYRAEGERIPPVLYNRLAALYEVINTLNSLNNAKKPVVTSDQKPMAPFTMTAIELAKREQITAHLSDFISQAYTALIIPGSNPPVSALSSLDPAIKNELRLILEADYKNAHVVFVKNQVAKVLFIVQTLFQSNPNFKITSELTQRLQILYASLNSLENMQADPEGITLGEIRLMDDKDTIRKQFQAEIRTIIALTRTPGLPPQVESFRNTLNKEDFSGKGLQELQMASEGLRQIAYLQFDASGLAVPNEINNRLSALSEMVMQFNKIEQSEKLALKPLAEQQKQREIIQQKLSELIDFTYAEYKILPPNSTVPFSLLEWELGKEEGMASGENRELVKIKNGRLKNRHNLFVFDHVYRAHELIFKAFGGVLPQELESRIEEIEALVDNLDNSQKGPLMSDIKPVNEVQSSTNPKELRDTLKESLNSLANNIRKAGLFPEKIFIPMTAENTVLTYAALRTGHFHSVLPSKILDTVIKLHSAIVRACRKRNVDTPDFIYDHLALLYAAAERLVDLSAVKHH